jgi:hypothetical protein
MKKLHLHRYLLRLPHSISISVFPFRITRHIHLKNALQNFKLNQVLNYSNLTGLS